MMIEVSTFVYGHEPTPNWFNDLNTTEVKFNGFVTCYVYAPKSTKVYHIGDVVVKDDLIESN